jgi:hypothetical protein
MRAICDTIRLHDLFYHIQSSKWVINMAVKCVRTPADKDLYVFIPACCYAGNQFQVRPYEYPPKFTLEDAQVEMPVTITDVPRLEPDGSGKIEVTTGDAATPCVGVFSPAQKRGILVFTVQQIQGKNIGLAYEEGCIRLTWPAKRESIYRWPHMYHNPEPWEDLPGDIPCKVLDFPCDDLAEFYRVFFENRKVMELDCQRPQVLPFDEQFEIQKEKFNTMNWLEDPGFYMVGTDKSRFQVWQPGWTGGAMSGYALMKLGGEQEWEREMRTLSFLFSTQCESGFFHGIVDAEGKIYSDAFQQPGADHWHLIRKSADVLYFLFKHFALMQERNKEIPEEFREGARKTADGFVRLWKTYGQFGQFVDVHTGEICVGGSTSAGIAPAGLAKAYAFFGDQKYLETAEESAEYYYQQHLRKGYTTGGPGEILQCVDSESGFGLLESFVVLYEVTGSKKWLTYAEECAHYCSSWVVSYNYQFPPESEFGRHHMKTVGSVFANLQNKHSAPGICTLSGDSLLKLWQWTQNPLYLELVKDIALTIGQYMSTNNDPIYDWDLLPEDREKGSPDQLEVHRLPQGFICERVNMSDWETDRCVGGVFHGSCWSETSNLLALAEVIPML